MSRTFHSLRTPEALDETLLHRYAGLQMVGLLEWQRLVTTCLRPALRVVGREPSRVRAHATHASNSERGLHLLVRNLRKWRSRRRPQRLLLLADAQHPDLPLALQSAARWHMPVWLERLHHEPGAGLDPSLGWNLLRARIELGLLNCDRVLLMSEPPATALRLIGELQSRLLEHYSAGRSLWLWPSSLPESATLGCLPVTDPTQLDRVMQSNLKSRARASDADQREREPRPPRAPLRRQASAATRLAGLAEGSVAHA